MFSLVLQNEFRIRLYLCRKSLMNTRRLLFIILMFSNLCAIAQTKDTLSFTNYSLPYLQTRLQYSQKKLYMPGLLIAGGMATLFNKKEGLKNELVEYRQNHFSNFRTHIDNYLQFSPLIATYALESFGVPSKTDFANQSVLMLKSEALMLATTYLLKNTVHELRPDGSNYQSFPSGHTAQAFMAATFLTEEYGYRYKWLPYAAYTVASGTGLLRMANNKHYICDVLVGAAIGVLSVKIAYWTHHYKWGKRKRPIE